MITVIDTFKLAEPITRDEARKIFLTTAPTYLGVVDNLTNEILSDQ